MLPASTTPDSSEEVEQHGFRTRAGTFSSKLTARYQPMILNKESYSIRRLDGALFSRAEENMGAFEESKSALRKIQQSEEYKRLLYCLGLWIGCLIFSLTVFGTLSALSKAVCVVWLACVVGTAVKIFLLTSGDFEFAITKTNCGLDIRSGPRASIESESSRQKEEKAGVPQGSRPAAMKRRASYPCLKDYDRQQIKVKYNDFESTAATQDSRRVQQFPSGPGSGPSPLSSSI